MRKSTDQTQKNRLRKEIKQSQIEELKQKQIEIQKQQQDIKEYAYKWIDELDKLYQNWYNKRAVENFVKDTTNHLAIFQV